MKLTPAQLQAFDRDGYLYFPSLFTPEETAGLNAAVPALYERREAFNVREKGSDAVRTNFAAHLYSAPFARLARHPRTLNASRRSYSAGTAALRPAVSSGVKRLGK